jgi:putative tryptophan/tyrosine transport system permease protein
MNWSSIFQFIGTDAPMQGFVWALLALGVFLAFRILNVADMSVDSLFPFAGIVSLNLINLGCDPLVSILVAIVCGMVIGYLNAALKVYLHIDPLLAGIVIMVALYTPNVILAPGTLSVADGKETIFTIIAKIIPNKAVTKILVLGIFLVAVFFLTYWFFGTEIGLSLRASGKNPEMAKANGINTDSRYILGMILSSALVALSGALYAQMNKYTTPDSGRGSIIVGLTIIFLGDVLFNNRSFKLTLVSIAVGGILYWLLIDIILEIPGFNTNYLKLMQGAFIVVVVLLGQLKKKLRAKKLLHANKVLIAAEGGQTK